MLKKIVVAENEGIQRIENYLLKYFPSLTRTQIFKLIRLKEIKVNQVKIKEGFKVKPNDIIEIWLPQNFLKSKNNKKEFVFYSNYANIFKVVYEDQNILVIDKPSGIPCQPIDNNNKPSIQTLLLSYLYDTKQWISSNTFTPSICNRLDTNTTGIVVAAKNGIALQELNSIFKNREIKKFYQCLAFGFFESKQKTETAYLLKNKDLNLVQISPTRIDETYLTIITKYKVLNELKSLNMSLLEIELITGRTHQIRAHLQYLNHPIVGDHKYGLNQYHKETKKYKNQALHAYKITFKNLDNKEYPQLSYLSNKIFFSKQTPWFDTLIQKNK